jgi:hypothetical protein
MALVEWSFDGLAFARINYNDGDAKFLPRQAILSKEPLIGGGFFRDVAGWNYQPLSFIASFLTKANQDAMLAKIGKVALLRKSTGEQHTVVLSSATPVNIAGRYCVDCTFE